MVLGLSTLETDGNALEYFEPIVLCIIYNPTAVTNGSFYGNIRLDHRQDPFLR